ncbi:MAG: GTPase Era [Candidatus Auribacterota bacterium]|nr:GTPase Era [Candidatus Auribacterota bacterium]
MNKKLFKTGVVSISGKPNVGKSTLLNSIIGQKMAIVSPKPQTTRGVIRGIYTGESMQVLFVDNPGFLKPRDKLDEFMFKQARESIKNADLVYFVVEPSLPDEESVRLDLKPIVQDKRPVFLVVNKIDSINKELLLPVIDAYRSLHQFDQIIPVSALKSNNTQTLLAETEKYLPEGEPLFPEDMVSDQFERYFVSELIREKVFEVTHQEVPYSVAVKIDEFVQRPQGKLYIRADIIVERTAHKSILIGKQGGMIKLIGKKARFAIESFMGCETYLELFVKVVEKWKEKDSCLREFGYNIE